MSHSIVNGRVYVAGAGKLEELGELGELIKAISRESAREFAKEIRLDLPDDYLSAEEVAELLSSPKKKVTILQVYKYCKYQQHPLPHKKVGKHLRISKRRALEWMQGRFKKRD